MSTPPTKAPAKVAMPSVIAPVDLAAERAELGSALEEALIRTLHSGAYVLGPEVEAFEREFAAYQRCAHGIGVASGTDALVLALLAAGVERGDRVLTSPFTFFASAGAICWMGAVPTFADVELDTALLDPKACASALDDETTCILPVHIYGQLADLTAFEKLSKTRGVALVEDAAQAHGAERDGRRAGEVGVAAAFSFYPTKNLSAASDAGLISARDDAVATRLRQLRDHGSPVKYEHAFVGTNSRLSALQAALLRIKLQRLEEWNDRRRRTAAIYDEAFAGNDALRPIRVAKGSKHVYHQYGVRVVADREGESGARDRVLAALRERGIIASIHYPKPVHLQPALAHLGHGPGDFPNAERLAAEILCLPIHPFLSTGDAERVAAELLALVG